MGCSIPTRNRWPQELSQGEDLQVEEISRFFTFSSSHAFRKERLFGEPEYAKLGIDAEDLSTSWDFWNPPPYSF